MLKANVKDNFRGQGQGLAIEGQGQDQGLETQGQGQGHGQLASRILEAKAMSSRTPSLVTEAISKVRQPNNEIYTHKTSMY